MLWGTKDFANLPGAKLLARSIPNAELQIIDGVGHEWNKEDPDRFNRVIGDFYRRQRP